MRLRHLVVIAAALWISASVSAQSDLIDIAPKGSLAVSNKAQFVVFHPTLPVAAVGAQGSVFAYGLEDGRSSEIARCPKGAAVAGAASRDGSWLAIGCEDGSIVLADWGAQSPAFAVGRQSKIISSVNFSPDSTEVVSASEDKAVVIWDIAGHRELRRFDAKRPVVFGGFTTNAVSVVAVTDEGELWEWDAKTSRMLRRTSVTDSAVLSAGISSSGTLLALGTETAQVNRVDLLQSLGGGPMRGAGSQIPAASKLPDSGQIPHTDTTDPGDYNRADRLLLYDLTKGAVAKELDAVGGQLRGLSFSADNRYLAAMCKKTKHTYLSVYDLQRGVEVFSQEAADGARLSGFSPNGKYLAGMSAQGQVSIFTVKGVQLGADVGDLAGQRIRSTSSQEPLLRSNPALTLAVMDLDSLGVQKDVGRTISEMLRNRIVGANLRVVAADRMQEIIKQQNFELSDRTDSQTAVGLGKVLNANKIVFGSVSALGTTYTVDVELVDVETAHVEGIREVLCQRCGPDDLPAVVAQLRASLVQ